MLHLIAALISSFRGLSKTIFEPMYHLSPGRQLDTLEASSASVETGGGPHSLPARPLPGTEARTEGSAPPHLCHAKPPKDGTAVGNTLTGRGAKKEKIKCVGAPV